MSKPPVRLPYDIILLILTSLESFDDLYSLIRTSHDYYQTYLAKQEQILKTIATRVFPECYMDIMDVQRPGRYLDGPSSRTTEDFDPRGPSAQPRSWIQYQMQWSATNTFIDEAQFQDFYTLKTRPELSSIPGTFRSEELNCLMEFETKAGVMIDQYHQNLSEYDSDGVLEIQCKQLHVDNLHLSMLMESVWQDGWDGGPYHYSVEEDGRLRKGIYLMYALTNHIYPYADLRPGLEMAQTAQNEKDMQAAQVAQAAGMPTNPALEPVSIPIPQPHDFYLDATFLYSLSFRDHIHLISVLYQLRSIYSPHFLLPEWLDSNSQGGLVFLHLLERFDFTKTDIYDSESGYYLNKTNNNRQARCRKVVKGLLAFVDSYGIYDAFQNQISRMERQLRPYVTKSGYNNQHFFKVDIYANTPEHKSILVLRPKHMPHITRPNPDRPLGLSHTHTDSQYLPKLKERLLSEDEHDPNQHFVSSIPVVDMLIGQEFEEEEEDDEEDELEEDEVDMYDEITGYLALAN